MLSVLPPAGRPLPDDTESVSLVIIDRDAGEQDGEGIKEKWLTCEMFIDR